MRVVRNETSYQVDADGFDAFDQEFTFEEFTYPAAPSVPDRLREGLTGLGYGDGFCHHGAGNADTYVYAINLSAFRRDNVVHVALIDTAED